MKKTGFTLIELLLVISIIAIMSTVVLRLISSRRSRDFAADGVRKTTIQKLVFAIESYRMLEGSYPTLAELGNPASIVRQTYLKDWPTEPEGSFYDYNLVNGGSDFELDVSTASVPGCYKYHSDWEEIRECTNCDANDVC